MTVYGYARVSSERQSLTAQVAELKAAGCQRVFREKISGARTDRKELARLLAELYDGDAVIVTRLERLARSNRDLLNTLAAVGEAGATFKSLHDSLGRHHEPARAVDVDGARWSRRIRAPSHPRPHQRGPQARAGQWRAAAKFRGNPFSTRSVNFLQLCELIAVEPLALSRV